MPTDATILNQSEPNWTEPQTCMACRNHALCWECWPCWPIF